MNNNKELVKAFFFYITFSILGPLLLFGGVGYFLDKILGTNFLVFVFIFASYIVTNVIMFRKLKKINIEVEKIGEEGEKKKGKTPKKQPNDRIGKGK